MMTEEEWRDIEGYNGKYQVSNLGRVKSLNYRHTGEEKILKQYKDKDGYLSVILYKNNKIKKFLVHRLAATAFIDNPDCKPCIDHINTVKDDNRVDNLRWCTAKENVNNPISKKRRLDVVKFGKDNRNSKAVFQYSLDGKLIREWGCAMDAERELGFDQCNISRCCSGKRKTAYGYKWKYA